MCDLTIYYPFYYPFYLHMDCYVMYLFTDCIYTCKLYLDPPGLTVQSRVPPAVIIKLIYSMAQPSRVAAPWWPGWRRRVLAAAPVSRRGAGVALMLRSGRVLGQEVVLGAGPAHLHLALVCPRGAAGGCWLLLCLCSAACWLEGDSPLRACPMSND